MLEIIRGSVRPVISIIFACVIAQIVTEKISIPPAQWALLSGVIIWWFTDKTITHIRGSK